MAVFAGMRRENWKLDLAALGPWVVGFGIIVLLAWPLSAYPDQSYRFLKYYGACILCVLVVVSTVERREHLMRLAGMASLGLLGMSLYGVYQRMAGVEVNPLYVDLTLELNQNLPGRVFGFYENPNTFAQVLLLLIPVAVGLMLGSKSWGGRFLGLCATGAGCIAIIMTYSRASWLGLAFAAAVFVLLWNRKLIPLAILVVCVAIPFLPENITNRLLTIFDSSDTSTSSRFPLYYAAGEFLTIRPLLGAGLGADAVRSAINDLNLYHGFDKFVHCHNIYLQVWCETGLFGLLTFVGGIFWTVKKGVKAVFRSACDNSVRLIIIGGASALMGSMLCGMADYLWNYPRVMLVFWFVCAIVLAGIRLAGREENHTPA
ncbi:MAG: O-antigen ligase family protein [Ruminiclostridium sp.]|nr:O-antigen ligase family protein [Ruminiclostridium sp.]